MQMTSTQFDMLLRNDLSAFIQRCFQHLDPNTEYAHNWHLSLLADRLTEVYEGRLKRLIINVPPRSLKSIAASVAFPAWVLGNDPSKRLICVSYGQDLSEKMARDCQAIMQSPFYQRAFATRLSTRSAAFDFETTARGGRMSTSVGGVLTGRGGDIVIIDDPVKPDEALSEAKRMSANAWYDNTLYSRLNNKKDGAIVIIMQRLHLDDLVGHVLSKEQWEVVSLPAVAQEPEVWRFNTLAGPQVKAREPGDLLHEGREGLAELEAIQHNLGTYTYSAQYLQSPVPPGGSIVKTAWLNRYREEEKPERFDRIIQSWDTANTAKELSDYSVCTTWGMKGKQTYLLHVLRKRMEYPDLKRAVIEQRRIWSANTVLIEDKASGTQLIQELRASKVPQVKGIKPIGDKVIRLRNQTPQIENGLIRFPERAPWWDEYEYELISFPACKYYDQVDSTSQALEWIETAGREPAAITYFKMCIARDRGWTMEQVEEHLDAKRSVTYD
jgi:predicted phage terminase large subunit-like protein